MVLSINGTRSIGYPYGEKIGFDPYFIPHIKMNSGRAQGLMPVIPALSEAEAGGS